MTADAGSSTLDAANRAALERVIARFRARIIEIVLAGGTGEVQAVAVLDHGSITDRCHVSGPRDYPLRRKP